MPHVQEDLRIEERRSSNFFCRFDPLMPVDTTGAEPFVIPLMAAVRNGHANMVATLADYGADLDIYDPITGRTALIEAILAGNKLLVDVLLERGANPDKPDYNYPDSGMSPLTYAVSNTFGNELNGAISRKLLEHGADPSIRSSPAMAKQALFSYYDFRNGERRFFQHFWVFSVVTRA